jgi:Flp pilus assembly protein CpaB
MATPQAARRAAKVRNIVVISNEILSAGNSILDLRLSIGKPRADGIAAHLFQRFEAALPDALRNRDPGARPRRFRRVMDSL